MPSQHILGDALRPFLPRRGLSAALVAVSVVGAVTAAPTPAAASQPTFLAPTSFARTDSRAPHTTITTGDAVVGAYQDDRGRRHVSKTYLTFDVAALRDKQVLEAEINLLEMAANDCTTARATEIWLTEPPRHAPTWARAPKELRRLAGPGNTAGCPPMYIGFDASDALREAVDAGWDTLTLVLRVAGNKQHQLTYGRTYSPGTGIAAVVNTAPDVPTELTMNYRPCTAEPRWVGRHDLTLGASTSDPDGDRPLTARVAYWPVDDPNSRAERVTDTYSTFSVTIPQAEFVDGRGYAWQVRAEDSGAAVSGWSEPCGFIVDGTRPSAPPTVFSALYPPDDAPPGGGELGFPGDFTFTANGVPDVVSYEWEAIGLPYGEVDAAQLGGDATVTLTPSSSGPYDMTVRSVDRAGNLSDPTIYRFWVRSTAPTVTAPEKIKLGDQLPATFTARQTGAVTFVYRVDQSPEVTVPVGADGTAAILVDPPANGRSTHTLRVWSVNAAGKRSEQGSASVRVDMAKPAIEIQPVEARLDEPVEATFSPGMAGVVSYTYWVAPNQKITVPAEPDGTARVTFTPPGGGGYWLRAYSTTATGLNSGEGEAFGSVGSAPVVTSTDYPDGVETGAPGVPGTFHFAAPIPNAVEYRYTFNWGTELTIPAAPDGTATTTITPPGSGHYTLRVYAVSASGRRTAVTAYTVAVAPA